MTSFEAARFEKLITGAKGDGVAKVKGVIQGGDFNENAICPAGRPCALQAVDVTEVTIGLL